jgi:hypothetical protein
MLQIVTRGRPPLAQHAMSNAERKASSRKARKLAQLNVEIPAEVRKAVQELADRTERTQADVILAAIQAYLDSNGRQ